MVAGIALSGIHLLVFLAAGPLFRHGRSFMKLAWRRRLGLLLTVRMSSNVDHVSTWMPSGEITLTALPHRTRLTTPCQFDHAFSS